MVKSTERYCSNRWETEVCSRVIIIPKRLGVINRPYVYNEAEKLSRYQMEDETH